MLTKSQLFLLLAVGLLYVSSIRAADVDCSKKPPFVNPKTCCPLPEFVTPELKEKCKEYDISPSPPTMESAEGGRGRRHHHHHPHGCLFSCVFNETGIFLDNKLDSSKLNSYLQVVFKDSTDLQKLTSEAFTNCTSKMSEFKGKMGDRPPPPSPPPGMPMCPPDAGFLMGCVFRKTVKHCPTSIWNNTQECNNMRDFFDNCKPPHRGPGGPPPSGEDM